MDIKINRLLRIVTTAAVLLCAGAGVVSAQEYTNTPVSISKEKVRINGRICYSHVVLERQTLFSISKAYNVSLDEIYRFNPSLKETGLVKNSIIIIPVKEEEEPVAVQAPAQEPKPEPEPAQTTGNDEGRKKKKKTHTVKWYESIDDIASRYGITVEELMAANDLEGRKLKSRMKLTIPEPGEVAVADRAEEAVGMQVDSTASEIAAEGTEMTEEDNEENPWWQFRREKKVTASLLLPFKATGTSGSKSNMDFYSGVLMAVNDLGQNGTNVDLNVYDIAEGNIEAAFRDMPQSDIIIGPVSVRDLTSTLAAAGPSVVISPLDPKAESLIEFHPDMIQAPTPHRFQYDDLAMWIKEDFRDGDRILLISEKGARITEAELQMKQSADRAGLTYSTFSYSILEGRGVERPLKGLMTETAVNRVMIVSESEAFVNDVVRNLNMMIHQKYNIILYGASKIRSFETIEVENFHKTNLHVSLAYYIDYNDPRVKNFLLKYRALFNAEPSQFAFQGYDIAAYFLDMKARYGKNWMNMMSEEEKSMLQSTFRCMKENEGGYVNHGIRRIVYEKDWTVSKVR